ncbi:MAG: FkbM family methyltransferase [Alphaproteobacteria bacterium]
MPSRPLHRPLVRALEAIAPRTAIALRAWKHCYTGEPELRLLTALCDRQKLSLDIGGNLGVYTYFMARFSKGVIAFEPNPELAARLRRGFASGVQVEACALSNQAGTAVLTVPLVDGAEEPGLGTIEKKDAKGFADGRRFNIETRRLDDHLEYPAAFIKIDAEGHELAILEGGREFLATHRPSLLIEAEERHRKNAVGTLSAYLEGHGYAGYFLMGKTLKPIAALKECGSRAAIPNNFLFFADDAQLDRVRSLLDGRLS